MDQKQLREDLSVIKRIMEESRQNFYNHGMNFIVWGILIISAFILTYTSMELVYLIPEYWYWIGAFGTGFMFEYIHGKQYIKKNPAGSAIGRIGSTLWMSILLTMIIFGVFGAWSGIVQHESGSGFIAGLLAIGYFVTGETIKIKWVKNLGYGWWLGAILLFYVDGSNNLLLWVVLMTLLQLIPGIILYVKGPKNG